MAAARALLPRILPVRNMAFWHCFPLMRHCYQPSTMAKWPANQITFDTICRHWQRRSPSFTSLTRRAYNAHEFGKPPHAIRFAFREISASEPRLFGIVDVDVVLCNGEVLNGIARISCNSHGRRLRCCKSYKWHEIRSLFQHLMCAAGYCELSPFHGHRTVNGCEWGAFKMSGMALWMEHCEVPLLEKLSQIVLESFFEGSFQWKLVKRTMSFRKPYNSCF